MPTIYETRIMSLIVLPKGEEIFSEMATIVSLENEAAGEFVVIKQHRGSGTEHTIQIEGDEWPVIRDAIDKMIGECRA